MAGDWIKMEVCLPDKPEVWQMAGILSIDADSVVGKLLRVWAWFDSHTEDGNAAAGKAVVDKQAGVPGFADAMAEVGWLVVTDRTVSIVSFDRHNGKSAKARIATNQRVAKHRASNAASNASATQSVLPRPLVKAIKERDGYACVYCDRKEGEYSPPETARDAALHIDHVIPVSRGGSDDVLNLACACGPCNLFKLDRTPEECGLRWPESGGKRLGNTISVSSIVTQAVTPSVTKIVTREEKRREEKVKRATRLPDDWGPSEDDLEYASRHGMLNGRVQAEVEKFRDWWKAAPGQKGVKADWHATWRTWVRKATESQTGKDDNSALFARGDR